MDDLLRFLEKANRAAQTVEWLPLVEKTLDLLMEISQAEAAILYPPVPPEDSHAQAGTIAQAEAESAQKTPWRGCPAGISQAWWDVLRSKLAQPVLFRGEHVRWIDRHTAVTENSIRTALDNLPTLQSIVILPLKNTRRIPGGVMLFNASPISLEMTECIAARMASELEKAFEMDLAHKREARLMALNDILGQLGATMSPDQVLRMFIERARQFLHVEAVSLFLIDETNGDLVLQMASQANSSIQVEKVRVPAGVGIIGRVTRSGEVLLVEDVQHDQRHYTSVDQKSGFVTRSILAVPLRSRPIDLGQGRGVSRERIIGGLEAINKIGGPFMPDDIEMLEVLARGASTILVVANMYMDANNMFVDVIQALVSAIDARDPYTEGRSQRISDFSAEIARELGMDEEGIHNVRLASLFHDVGKMGVSKKVLGKTDSLIGKGRERPPAVDPATQNTTAEVDPGPTRLLGGAFFSTPASGPAGENDAPLSKAGEETSQGKEDTGDLINQILVVANVFDSMTADRQFEEGMSGQEVLLYMRENIGTRFDRACVEALARAYSTGKIKVMRRR